MAKKPALYADAERLYVQDQLTLEAIKQKLDVSVRTLTDWKKEGDWDARRKGFLAESTTSHEKTFKLYNKLLDKSLAILDEGGMPDPSTLYLLKNLAPMFRRLKEYEDSTAGKTTESKGLTEDAIREIEENVLGLKR